MTLTTTTLSITHTLNYDNCQRDTQHNNKNWSTERNNTQQDDKNVFSTTSY